MGTNLIGEIVANNGTYFLSNGEYIGAFDQIIVRGAGIEGIAIFEYIGENLDDMTYVYLSNSTETILPDGLRITPINNGVFARVEILVNTGVENGTGLELVLA
jgi:hypothetical protein